MAKVKGPLFSIQARGKFGNTLIYTGDGNVKRMFIPRDPKSPAQLAQRDAFMEFVMTRITREEADLLYALIGHIHDDRYLQLQSAPSWIAPTFSNGWVNYGAGQPDSGYYKDAFGVVHIRGNVKSGTIGAVIFNLPAGYRPAVQVTRVCFSDVGYSVFYVTPGGDVTHYIGGNAYFDFCESFFAT